MNADEWLAEAQGLARAIDPIWTDVPVSISVSYRPDQHGWMKWRASCGQLWMATGDTASDAMRALLRKLRDELSKRLAEKRAELARLETANEALIVARQRGAAA